MELGEPLGVTPTPVVWSGGGTTASAHPKEAGVVGARLCQACVLGLDSEIPNHGRDPMLLCVVQAAVLPEQPDFLAAKSGYSRDGRLCFSSE